jgi:hypothetical protein
MKNLLIPIVLFLAACSGVKPYPNSGNKNFSVKAETDAVSVLLKNAGASLDIYRVNPDCTTVYQGNVRLDQPVTEIALPPKQPSYLVFALGVLSGSSDIGYKTLLEPRAGYRYMATVREIQHLGTVPETAQVDNLLDIVIYEMNPGGRQSRALEFSDFGVCQGLIRL